jgi:hypothetical protein
MFGFILGVPSSDVRGTKIAACPRSGYKRSTAFGAMIFFRILFGIDVAIAAVALWFFSVGLNDGSVSSFNMYLWMEMLGCIAAVLAGGLLLKAAGRNHLAKAVLMLLALPGVGYVLFFLILIISNPRWN